MKAFRKQASLAFYLLHSGFQAFKLRLREELSACRGINLDNCADDESLYRFYVRGEPTSYVMDRLCGCEKDAEY